MSSKGRAEQVVELFRAWRDRPDAVDAGWREFFAALDDSARAYLEKLAGTAPAAAARRPMPRARARPRSTRSARWR